MSSFHSPPANPKEATFLPNSSTNDANPNNSNSSSTPRRRQRHRSKQQNEVVVDDLETFQIDDDDKHDCNTDFLLDEMEDKKRGQLVADGDTDISSNLGLRMRRLRVYGTRVNYAAEEATTSRQQKEEEDIYISIIDKFL